ncbi:MAG: glycerophosphodiester phosphodiesterase family protein [Planctomycetota bacterium]
MVQATDGARNRKHGQSIFARVWTNIRRSARAIIVYEVYFRVLTAALLGPMIVYVGAQLVAFSGTPVVNNEHLGRFLLRPGGAAVVAVIFASVLAVAFAERAGLLLLVSAADRGHAQRPMDGLMQTVLLLPRFALLGAVLVTVVGIVLAPACGMLLLIKTLFLSRHDISYYLAAWPAEFVAAIAAAGVILLGLTVLVLLLHARWLFSLPLIVFHRTSTWRALRTSATLSRGRRWRIIRIIGGWLAVSSAATGVVLALLEHACDPVLALVAGNRDLEIVVLLVNLVIHTVVVLLAGALIVSVGAGLVWELYKQATAEHGLPLIAPATEIHRSLGRVRRRLLTAGIWAALAVIVGANVMAVRVHLTARMAAPTAVAVTAHRGASLVAPENTLAAIRAAIDQGADWIETDVQRTADGVVVLFHDTDLKRVAGVDRALTDMTYDELKQIDVGAPFSPEFAGQRVPTLKEAIRAVKGRAKLNIELKGGADDEQLVADVVAILRARNVIADSVIVSTDVDTLAKVRQLEPDLTIGLGVAVTVGDVAEADVDFISAGARLATAAFIRRMHRNGKRVLVWTVDDPTEMVRFIEMGVDGITTNDPQALRKAVDEYETLSPERRLLLAFRRQLAR